MFVLLIRALIHCCLPTVPNARLTEGLQAKEQALASTQKELRHAKKQLASLKAAVDRRQSLEAELSASRANLEELTQELEAARAASKTIE